MKSILDPTFKYVHSSRTNIAETFAKIRKEMQDKSPKVSTVQEIRQLNILQHKKFNKG
jgi:hypothetical protein